MTLIIPLKPLKKYNKRPSPPVSAQDFPNEIKVGNDGKEYVSRSDKKGIFKWHKINYDVKTAYDYYMQLPQIYLDKKFIKYDIDNTLKKLKNIEKELKKHNIYLLYIRWKNVGNFIDNAWDEARLILSKKTNPTNFIFYTDNRMFWALHEGELSMQWDLDKQSKIITNDIFTKEFKKSYIPPKNITKAMIIKLKK